MGEIATFDSIGSFTHPSIPSRQGRGGKQGVYQVNKLNSYVLAEHSETTRRIHGGGGAIAAASPGG